MPVTANSTSYEGRCAQSKRVEEERGRGGMLPRFLTHGTSKVMRDQEGELDPITLFPEKFPLFEVPLVLLDLNFSNNKLPIQAYS